MGGMLEWSSRRFVGELHMAPVIASSACLCSLWIALRVATVPLCLRLAPVLYGGGIPNL
jgi:hypothetical protein